MSSPSCLDYFGRPGTGEGYNECVDNKCVCNVGGGGNSNNQCCTETGGDGMNGCASTCEYPDCYFSFFHLLLLLTSTSSLRVPYLFNHSSPLCGGL